MTAAPSAPQISCPVELAVLRARVAALEARNEPVKTSNAAPAAAGAPSTRSPSSSTDGPWLPAAISPG